MLDQGRRSPMAAIGSDLENAVGVVGNRGAPIVAAMATGIRAMMRWLIGVKKMMNPVRRGVKKEEQKNAGAKEIGGACEFTRHKGIVTGHRVDKQTDLTPSAKRHSRGGRPIRTSRSIQSQPRARPEEIGFAKPERGRGQPVAGGRISGKAYPGVSIRQPRQGKKARWRSAQWWPRKRYPDRSSNTCPRRRI